ncbi:MAG TPA: T9SS type A sorting domain-containing protein [Flavipsychrobacter sp.]|nr:T9SS type A sorting domain-containing protein [Flavipsychrobacter sp.]
MKQCFLLIVVIIIAVVCFSLRCIAQAGIITTIAGTDSAGLSGDSGPAILAQLNVPGFITLDTAGNLYVSDQDNNVVRKIDRSTGIITSIVSISSGPRGIAIDKKGNLYISNRQFDRVMRKTASGGYGIYAGEGYPGYSGDSGLAYVARMNTPEGLCLDTSGNLYIADEGNSRIRVVNIATNIITTIAGTGALGYSGDGGLATKAQLNYPTGVIVDRSGNIYIADNDNNCIRIVNASGIITTYAGTGIPGYNGDGGIATDTQLYNPNSVALDAYGDLYIADQNNHCIRRVDKTTRIITTVAGNGKPGFSGDGGSALAARLYFPASIAINSSGDLYISDQNNNRIRKVADVANAIAEVNKSDNIDIYPNPVIDKLIIKTLTKDNTLTITNIIGRIMLQRQLTETQTTIDITTFPSGVYNVCMRNNNGIAFKKLVKL